MEKPQIEDDDHSAALANRRAWIFFGKLRALVGLRDTHSIRTERYNFARVVASVLADWDALSTLELRRRIQWCGLTIISGSGAQKLVREAIVNRAHARFYGRRRSMSRRKAGELLELTSAERDELTFWWPIAIDETPAAGCARRAAARKAQKAQAGPEAMAAADALAAERRARDAARKRAKRRAEGRPTQQERSVAGARRRAAIAASGLSSATFYRRRAASFENFVSAESVASAGGLLGGYILDASSRPERRVH